MAIHSLRTMDVGRHQKVGLVHHSPEPNRDTQRADIFVLIVQSKFPSLDEEVRCAMSRDEVTQLRDCINAALADPMDDSVNPDLFFALFPSKLKAKFAGATPT